MSIFIELINLLFYVPTLTGLMCTSEKMGWFYIAQYAKFEKAEYRKQFEFLCEKMVAPAYKDILGFAKEALFLSSDGSFHRFAPNTFDIIPKSYFAQFTRIVRAIENSQLTPEELRIKNLFLEKAPGLDNELRIPDSL